MKSQIEKIFDAERPECRYWQKDLLNFIHKSKIKSMNSMTRVQNYQQEFQKIASWLKKQKHITEEECNKYFLKGILKALHERLELSYIATNSVTDFIKAFDRNIVVEELEKMFEHSQFNIKASDSEDDDSDGDSTDSDSDDSKSSDSDMSEAYYQQTRKMQKAL